MPLESQNFAGPLIAIYLLIVAALGIASLVTIAVLFKHAEKRSVATGVSTLYGILFAIIVITSIGALLRL